MERPNKSTINFSLAKKRLGVTWLILSAIILLIFIAWTIGSPLFADKATVAWNWLLPIIMPTLSLVIGIFVVDTNTQTPNKVVDVFIYRIAICLSVFYLMLILFIIMLYWVSSDSIFIVFGKSNLFLGPIQGLVSAAIGVFFYKRE